VCGKTDKDERRKTLAAFSSGKLQYVVNVGVLTEGFDDPGVEVVVMGRPTKSRSLYAQMVGRATRPLPGLVDGLDSADERRMAIGGSGKPACLVVDFVGNSGRHKLMTSADILGGNVSDEAVDRAVAKLKEAGGPVDMAKALEDEEKALEFERAREAARRANLKAKAAWAVKQVNPFDVFQLSPVKARGWNAGKALSGKQRAILEKAGIDPDSVDYAGGRQLLNEVFRRWEAGLCSYKQARILRKHGYDGNQTRDEAAGILDGIFGKREAAGVLA
jgi:type I site-specific restriction endonuclease